MKPNITPASPIGIFDSGPGGLAVLREVRRLLPAEDVIYLGDTARQPYGPQTIDQVKGYVLEISGWLISQGVKIVLIACNTASVAGSAAARQKYPQTPIFGMVEPAVKGALRVSRSRRIGVWGTEITINSHAYEDRFHEAAPGLEVMGIACSDLLRLAEKGQIDDKSLLQSLSARYFQPLADFSVDTLVLGCTDLTCVRDVIDRTVPPFVTIIDPAEEVVLEARNLLEERSLLRSPRPGQPSYRYCITGGDTAGFSRFTASFLATDPVIVERVALS